MDENTRRRLFADRECQNALTEFGNAIKALAPELEGAKWSGSVPNNPMTSAIEYKEIVLECAGVDRKLAIQIYRKAEDPAKKMVPKAAEILSKKDYQADAEPVGEGFEIRWNPGTKTSTDLANEAFQDLKKQTQN